MNEKEDFNKNMDIFTTFYHFPPFITTYVENNLVINSVHY